MKALGVTLIIFILLNSYLFAQHTTELYKVFGSPYSSTINCICTDMDGSTYVGGEFTKSLLMGPYKFKDKWGGFIAKVDDQNQVIWMKRADMKFRNMELIDSSLIVFAQNSQTVNFAGTELQYRGQNFNSVLASISINTGDVKWIKEISGEGDVYAADMTICKKDIFITGSFRVGMALDKYTLKKTHEKNNFIARLTAEGKVIWLNKVSGGDSFITGATISAIAANQNGDFVISGEIAGSADFAGYCFDVAEFNSKSENTTSEGCVYYAYFTGDGKCIRVNKAITEAEVTDIALFGDQVYLCGYYSGAYLLQRPIAASIFGDTVVLNSVQSPTGSLLETWFVISLRDNEPLWALTTKGKNSSRALSLVVDDQGSCYAGGYFYDHIILPDGSEVNAINAEFSAGALVMKIDRSGKLLWTHTASSPTGINKFFDVSLNHSLVVCGEISGSAVFDKSLIQSRGKHQNGFTYKFDL